MLDNLNRTFDRFMPILTPCGVALGLLLGSYIAWLKPLVIWLFAFVTLTGAMGMGISDLSAVMKKPTTLFMIFFCAHVATPCLVWAGTSLLFPGNQNIITGYILLSAIPVAVSSYVWTGIFYGAGPMTLTVILFDTILAPVITPLTIRIFTNSLVVIDTRGMIISLLWMVVFPSIVGMAFNSIRPGITKKIVPVCKPFSKVALFLVVTINAGNIAESVSISWSYVPILFVNICITAGSFFLAFGIANLMKLPIQDTVSMTITGGLRNISAALVLALNFFPPETSIPVVFGIIFQQTLVAFVCKGLFGRYQKRMIQSKTVLKS